MLLPLSEKKKEKNHLLVINVYIVLLMLPGQEINYIDLYSSGCLCVEFV